MKTSVTKVLALGGLCALFVGAASTAFAQGYDHHDGNYDHSQYHQADRHYQADRHWGDGQNRFRPNQFRHNQFNQYQDHHYNGNRDNQYRHFDGNHPAYQAGHHRFRDFHSRDEHRH